MCVCVCVRTHTYARVRTYLRTCACVDRVRPRYYSMKLKRCIVVKYVDWITWGLTGKPHEGNCLKERKHGLKRGLLESRFG